MNSHVPVLFVAAPFALKLFNIIPPDPLLRRLLGLNANHSNLLWTRQLLSNHPQCVRDWVWVGVRVGVRGILFKQTFIRDKIKIQ